MRDMSVSAPNWSTAIAAALAVCLTFAAGAAGQTDAPQLRRGDFFIVFRETRAELPGGESRMLGPHDSGRAIDVEGRQLLAIVRGAKLRLPVDNVVSGRWGVARISAEIRERPDAWMNYLIRAELRRRLGDHERALEDIAAVPDHADEYFIAVFFRGVIHGDMKQWQAAVDDLTKAIDLTRPHRNRDATATMFKYRGAAHLRLDKLDEALADLEQAIKLEPDDAEVHRWRGVFLDKKGETTEAVEAFKKAKELDPYDDVVRSDLARIYERLRLFDLALAELNDVLGWREDNVPALFARARIRLKKGELAESLADLERVLELEPEHVGATLCEANVYYVQHDHAALKDVCQRLLKLRIERGEDYAQRGIWLLLCDKDRDAMNDFDQAISLGVRDTAVHEHRAKVHARRSEWDKAIAEATESLKLDPRNKESCYVRGMALLWMGKTREVLADLDRAIRIEPGFVRALVARANALIHLGRDAEALTDLRAAFDHEPGELRVVAPLCELLCDAGQEGEAVKVIDEHMRHAGQSAECLAARARCWRRLDDYEKALADLSETIRMQPKSGQLHLRRADCYAHLGDIDAALRDCDKAEAIAPDRSLEITCARGLVYLEGNELEKAVAAFEQCVAMDEQHPAGHAGIANVRSTAEADDFRDGAKAVQHARRACELIGWNESGAIALLARSYAEAGDFDESLKWMSKALDLATPRERLVLSEQLELLEAGQPIRRRPAVASRAGGARTAQTERPSVE